MLKIFSTQLQGLFRKITDQQEEALENSARLLAQALAGEGNIYIFATEKMKGVAHSALYSQDAPESTALFPEKENLSPSDRVLIISESDSNPEAMNILEACQNVNVPVVSISPLTTQEGALEQSSDFHINTFAQGGVVPDDAGNRTGHPEHLVSLFAVLSLFLTLHEMLLELE
ncbi:DUF2529 family protein [Bacillus sp. FJAT-44742]|uniref:DUF2529 family protein n=1 Tax=Bacillus sp. FJAT-44742 TaxID=2014005 RepID=UPI000C234145|nr:DUF2529 family protein [Bacillus sp. FJAT-44742]